MTTAGLVVWLAVALHARAQTRAPLITDVTPAGVLTWQNRVAHAAVRVESSDSPAGPWADVVPAVPDVLVGANPESSVAIVPPAHRRYYRLAVTPPFTVYWCRLESGFPAYVLAGQPFAVRGRVLATQLTALTDGVDSHILFRAQAGYRSTAGSWSTPTGGIWTDAQPSPGWSATAAGEPGRDEYEGLLSLPLGTWYVAVRFSGDAGNSWLYGDLKTSEDAFNDGSNDGFFAEPGMVVEALETGMKVVAAQALDTQHVRVYFNNPVSPSSVNPSAAAFTLSSGASALAASVFGKVVDLTTSTLVQGATYTVQVGPGQVIDKLGQGVGGGFVSATFTVP